MINKIACLLFSLLLTCSAHAEVWQARYGVAETFNFKLYNADGTLDVDEVDGGTEVSVSCNEGAETTATNDFVDEGTFYSIALTSGELSCERVAVVVAATTTEVFFIQTINHASAMTPVVWGDVQNFGGTAGTFASGRPEVNTTHLAGTSQTSRDIGASVLLSSGTGTGQLKLASGYVAMTWADIAAPTTTVNLSGTTVKTATDVENDTVDIQNRLPAALVSGRMSSDMVAVSGDTTAADNIETSFDDTAGEVPWMGWTRQGTAQAASATTVTLDASAPFGDNTNIGGTLWVKGATNGNYWQPCLVSAYVASTKVATVSCASGFVTPTGTISYKLAGTAPSSGGSGATAAEVWSYGSGRTLSAATNITSTGAAVPITAGGLVSADVTAISTDSTAANNAESFFDGTGYAGTNNVIPTVTTTTTATNLTNLPTIPANWLTAAGTAADFTTEVTAGLATASALTTVGTNVSDVEAIANKLDSAMELDSTVYRFTANALEQAPTGTGESLAAIADAVWDEALAGHATAGTAGAALTAAGSGGTGDVLTIEGTDATTVIDARIAAAGLATASSLSTVGTNVSTALTRIGTPTDLGGGATLAANAADIEAQTDDIGAAGAGLTVLATQASVNDIPTNAELATALGTADDAVLAAMAALNNLSADQVWNYIVEDQGSVQAKCMLAFIGAIIGGDTATSGLTTTFEEHTGTETRAVSVVVSAGNRTTTLTCPTY